jgi:hypothetical protein
VRPRTVRTLSPITEWLPNGSDPTLLAIDAPLGWPKPLAESLSVHKAGMPFSAPAHFMFPCATDSFIQREL